MDVEFVATIIRLRVRSFSLPGSTPVCGRFFSRTNVGSYLHRKEKTPHTGVDPGKLNERTLIMRMEASLIITRNTSQTNGRRVLPRTVNEVRSAVDDS